MEKPAKPASRILIDVDGVLNIINLPVEGNKTFRALGFPITYNPAAAGWLLGLSQRTGAELWWGTTWNERANKLIAPEIGLPQLPVLDIDVKYRQPAVKFSQYASVGEYKAASLLAQDFSGVFVWFDDEPDLHDHLSEYLNPYLHVWVDAQYGLTPEHIEVAENFLRENS